MKGITAGLRPRMRQACLSLVVTLGGCSAGHGQDTRPVPDIAPPVDTTAAPPSQPEAVRARELSTQAERASTRGTPASLRHAKDLWLEAAALHHTVGDSPAEAAARNNAGRAFQRLGERDSALEQFGRAIELRDYATTRSIITLANTSPLLEPSRSVIREARFVRDVKTLLAATPGGPALANGVTSATDAMAALDALSAARVAVLRVTSVEPLLVEYRRWAYRNAAGAPWTPLTTDTSVTVSAVTYQLRYTDPLTRRDTLVVWPCADGCVIKLPVRRAPSR